MLFQWRKLERQGALMAVSAGKAVVPASELAAARAEISKLQRVLGKKTLDNEIRKEAVAYAAEKSGLRAPMPMRCAASRRRDGRQRLAAAEGATTPAVEPGARAGAPTASRSSATRVRPSPPRSSRTAATERSWRSGRGRTKCCRASPCARCSSRPWRSASAQGRPFLRDIPFSSCPTTAAAASRTRSGTSPVRWASHRSTQRYAARWAPAWHPRAGPAGRPDDRAPRQLRLGGGIRRAAGLRRRGADGSVSFCAAGRRASDRGRTAATRRWLEAVRPPLGY